MYICFEWDAGNIFVLRDIEKWGNFVLIREFDLKKFIELLIVHSSEI